MKVPILSTAQDKVSGSGYKTAFSLANAIEVSILKNVNSCEIEPSISHNEASYQ